MFICYNSGPLMLSVNMEGYAVQYVNLGQTGLKVSRLVLGCMSYGGRWYR